jgi:hypothetical protein
VAEAEDRGVSDPEGGWKHRRASAMCLLLGVALSIGLGWVPGFLMVGMFVLLGIGLWLRTAGDPSNRRPRVDPD